MDKKHLSLFGAISGFFLFPISAFASCANYPYKIIGAKIIPLENDNLKIISSYQVSVNYDDADEVVDAIEDGRLEAEAAIARLMRTEIAKECNKNTKKISQKLMSKDPEGNESRQFNDEVLKEKVCSLVGRSAGVLNGVADVGQCYEPGKHVYVTVGIKPETIAAAGQLGENMKTIKNLDDIKGSNQSEIGDNKSSTRNVEGFSNFDADF